MRNDRTNRLALLLVVFCCLGTTAMAMPPSTQTVLTVVVGGLTSHIAFELKPYDFQLQNRNTVPSFVTHKNPILSGLNMELQNLPPPSGR